MAQQVWLMKSEPEEVSIDDVLAMPKKTVAWTGVRNYQARNFMMRDMQVGDIVLFYHSSCPQPGIVGLARVASKPYPDATQFDPTSKYFDMKATLNKPRWFHVDVQITQKTRWIGLKELRDQPQLSSMRLLAKGNRLSITPVSEEEWQVIQTLL
ncbi:EVE domain-containing protein [Ferrovum sp. PN-J185]|uniref:EVE domain-containing protein n=1 Tax=Ferrovum sp. PN-J185 TaxID=1356306 RepID=UPI0007995CCA|nr:EVE domain-containing protein [Ferrovum sp. PN-J185]KXW55865.1 EVE domain protein [Ferrovum sp. PN-J185]